MVLPYASSPQVVSNPRDADPDESAELINELNARTGWCLTMAGVAENGV
jgi:hypothetical protein